MIFSYSDFPNFSISDIIHDKLIILVQPYKEGLIHLEYINLDRLNIIFPLILDIKSLHRRERRVIPILSLLHSPYVRGDDELNKLIREL
jgi:hypothetical protein